MPKINNSFELSNSHKAQSKNVTAFYDNKILVHLKKNYSMKKEEKEERKKRKEQNNLNGTKS